MLVQWYNMPEQPPYNSIDYPLAGGDGFGVGSTPPGAQLPFAMMRLSPDTAFDNVALEWRHFGGYYYGELGDGGP